MKTTQLDQNTVDQFILEVTLIDPIVKIINNIKNKEYRDCDIKWLDTKLENFTAFACKTFGLNVIMPSPTKGKVLNDYTYNQYLTRFSTLLTYFKNLVS